MSNLFSILVSILVGVPLHSISFLPVFEPYRILPLRATTSPLIVECASLAALAKCTDLLTANNNTVGTFQTKVKTIQQAAMHPLRDSETHPRVYEPLQIFSSLSLKVFKYQLRVCTSLMHCIWPVSAWKGTRNKPSRMAYIGI